MSSSIGKVLDPAGILGGGKSSAPAAAPAPVAAAPAPVVATQPATPAEDPVAAAKRKDALRAKTSGFVTGIAGQPAQLGKAKSSTATKELLG